MTEREPIIGVYAGSFDPITRGHMGIICESILALDELYILIARNPDKEGKYLITEEDRLQNISDAIEDFKNEINNRQGKVTINEIQAVKRIESGACRIHIDVTDGLTAEFAMNKGARQLMRGLRPIGDFEVEQKLANLNKKIANEMGYALRTTFLPTPDLRYVFTSSSEIKMLAKLGAKESLYESLYPSTVELVVGKLKEKGNVGVLEKYAALREAHGR